MKYANSNKLYINGVWKEGRSDKLYENTNPYNGEVLSTIKLANKNDIDDAYNAALQAQKAWQETDKAEKEAIFEKAIAYMESRFEDIVNLLVEESGSSIMKANIEVGASIATLREASSYPAKMETKTYHSIIPGKENRVSRLPLGVVGVIVPWNFPLVLAMRSVAGAIATGNTVVLKPDLQTYIAGGSVIVEAFEAAGLPKGVLNLVIADIEEIGDYFVEHPIPRLISFTGSTSAGKHIGAIATQNLKKVILELGGNNAFIVLDDADIEQAASAAAFGRFLHQGQICLSVNRIIVDRKIYLPFVETFKAKVQKIKAGDPREKDTFVGPLINRKQVEKVLALIEKSVSQGAKIELEGKVEGNVISPYILTDVTPDMAVAQNEIFGPVASIIPVENEEEAIEVANASIYGLSGAVFSGSLERGLRVADQIHTGMIHVNDQSVNEEAHMPFGGEKSSGLGRFGGEFSFEEFTTVKWTSVQKQPRQFPF